MRYLLLSVLVIFAIGLFAVEDAFGIEYARVNIQPGTDTQGCEDDNSCHSPHTITITRGDWIKWKNLDTSTHDITSLTFGGPYSTFFSSGVMNSGSTFEHRIMELGEYPYYCSLHPWAKGLIIVKEGSSTPSSTQTQTTTTSSKIPTILVLDPLPSRVDPEESLTISGTLKTPEGFTPHGVTIYIHGKMTYRGNTFEPTPATLKTDVNGKFLFKNNFDLPPEIDEKLTIDFYVVYKGGKNFEPSKSKTYRVLFTPTTTTTTTTSTTTSTLPAGAITYDVWACCPVAPESRLVLKSWQFIEKENYNQIKLYLTASNLREEFLRDVYAYPDSIILKNKDGGLYRGDSDPHSITFSYKETSRPRDATVTYDIDKKYGKSDKFSIYIQDALVGNQPQCDSPITLVNVVGRAEKLTYSIKYCKAGELGELTLSSSMGGGCLIATATFGSELAPQVQFLRELRDNTVLQTESGTSFMAGFNQFYYSFSPTIADYERENPAFKETVKITLTPLLTSLTLLQYADIDSESEMLGYGISIILLNIGMYFVAPAVLIMTVRKRI